MLNIVGVITNGYVDVSTMERMSNDGYSFICTIPANTAHPHAMSTDKLSIFGKYEEPQIQEGKTLCE